MENRDFENIIIVNAQRWGTLGKWWKEKVPGGGALKRWVGEKFVPDYQNKMEALREVDDNIYNWTQELDGILKEIKTAFKSRRIIDVAILFANIDGNLRKIEQEGEKLEDLYESGLEDFEDEYVGNLEILKRYHEGQGKTAQAGFWEDIGRKFVSRRMERETTKKRNIAIKKLIADTETVIGKVKSFVKSLAEHRKSGYIGNYVSVLKKIEKAQQEFQKEFNTVYETHLREPVEEILQKEENQRIIAEQRKKERLERIKQEEIVKKKTEEMPAASIQPEPIPDTIPQAPYIPEQESEEEVEVEKAPETQRTPVIENKNDIKQRIEVEPEEPKKLRIETSKNIVEEINKLSMKPNPQFQLIDKEKIKQVYSDIDQVMVRFYDELVEAGILPESNQLGMRPVSSEEPPKILEGVTEFEAAQTKKDPSVPRTIVMEGVEPEPEPPSPGTARSIIPEEPAEIEIKFDEEGEEKKPFVRTPSSKIRSEQLPGGKGYRVRGHKKFIKALTKAAKHDDPKLLALMLLKYAEFIEDKELDNSLKLTAIAEGILDAK